MIQQLDFHKCNNLSSFKQEDEADEAITTPGFSLCAIKQFREYPPLCCYYNYLLLSIFELEFLLQGLLYVYVVSC